MKNKTERIAADVTQEVKKRLRIIAAHEGVALQVVLERLINSDYERLQQAQREEQNLVKAE